jgi:hypothetical protein
MARERSRLCTRRDKFPLDLGSALSTLSGSIISAILGYSAAGPAIRGANTRKPFIIALQALQALRDLGGGQKEGRVGGPKRALKFRPVAAVTQQRLFRLRLVFCAILCVAAVRRT